MNADQRHESSNPWLSLPWRPPYVLPQDAAGAVDYITTLPPGPRAADD
ncbi:MAG: hypothetical protein ABI725_00475 [Chloroflexota bacterium]